MSIKQALVLKDAYNDPESYKELKDTLTKENFKIVEINTIRDLEIAKKQLDVNKPCLYYKNCYINFDSPSIVWNFHSTSKFTFLKISGEIISFLPNAVSLKNNTPMMVSDHINTFSVSNLRIKHNFKNKEKPIIFLSTFNRELYLRLTLNSLIFSLCDLPVDLKIFLNEATDPVKKVASEFANKYNFIELIEVQKNSYFSVYNLAVQHFKPKNFIIMEDDFILSPSVKHFFPNWAYQFIDRLYSFDAVGWGIHADNSFWNVPFIRDINSVAKSDWEIGDLNRVLCGAQCLAVSTKYWFDTLTKNKGTCHYHVPLDQHLLKGNFCFPSLKAYHIGWNQEMEGFVSVNSGNRFGNAPLTNKLKSLKTGEEKEYSILDIYKGV